MRSMMSDGEQASPSMASRLVPVKYVVVVFDICSSSNIIEQLTVRGHMERFLRFLTAIEGHLKAEQKTITFRLYKFIGDGWILLFPDNTGGGVLLDFLRKLCIFFRKELRRQILPYLDVPPSITGLTFGLDEGPLLPMRNYRRTEYVGRALNIACRLQNAVKDKGGAPAYKALASNGVFNDYLAPATGFSVKGVKRKLRNIQGEECISCKKIELLQLD